MIEKFEAGKKYFFKDTPKEIAECIYISPSGRPLVRYENGYEVLLDPQWDHTRDYRKNYVEYIEPKKGTVWVNVYDYGCGTPACHLTRGAADLYAGKNRLACVEVHWVEGQGL